MQLSYPFESFRTGVLWWELAYTSGLTMSLRFMRLAPLGAPLRLDDPEWGRMLTEKVQASLELQNEVLGIWMDFWSGRYNPWVATHRTLKPLHRRTTHNVVRLATARRR